MSADPCVNAGPYLLRLLGSVQRPKLEKEQEKEFKPEMEEKGLPKVKSEKEEVKKELKKELAALENTACELQDRLDTALDDADDDDGDFADRLSSEEARAGEELVGAACGRRYTFEQREHTIKLLGKQVMPSQIPGILVRFKVFDISCCASHTKVFFLSAHGDHFLTLRPHFFFSMTS
jgi:hypothetical protein